MLLHRCGPACAAEPGLTGATSSRGRQRHFTVDLHCHTFVPSVEALVADRPQKLAEPELMLRNMGAASVAHNNAVMLPQAGRKMTDLAARLGDMDAMGVDVQVVSPSPTQYYYWADEALGAELVRVQNEAIAELCATHPERLVGLATIALQHPSLAVEQLTYAVRKLGLKGIEVSTSVNGAELADEQFDPVWAKAEELGCIVFIHPFGTSLGERLNRFYLSNTIGQPLETTVALSHLIFGGTLDRYPGLRIVAAHGGGYLPSYIGRSNHAHRARPEAGGCRKAPSEYLRQIWFDSLVYEPQALRHLIAECGVSQLVVGTDYPFDMGSYDIHQLLARLPELSDADRAAILGGNAAALLGLVVPEGEPRS